MKTITCKVCGSTVKVAGDVFKCSVCDAEYWGYTKETLPKDILSLINFVTFKSERPHGSTGWLISTVDGQENKVFGLRDGENIIGRANPEQAPDVLIENDDYVSRNHATVQVNINLGQYVYILFDSRSLNGTFVNTLKVAPETPYELKDGDTIQFGQTKLVLKTISDVSNQEDAQELVKKMEKQESIPVNRMRKTAITTKIITE